MIHAAKLDAPQKPTTARRFATTLAAAATALAAMTAAAVPARAGSDDIAKILAGVAAIAIIGTAINNNKAKAAPPPQPHPYPYPQPGHGQGRPHQAPLLPSVCTITISGYGVPTTSLYSERCLVQQSFQHRLPKSCASPVQFGDRKDRLYRADCLVEAGFRTGRQRY